MVRRRRHRQCQLRPGFDRTDRRRAALEEVPLRQQHQGGLPARAGSDVHAQHGAADQRPVPAGEPPVEHPPAGTAGLRQRRRQVADAVAHVRLRGVRRGHRQHHARRHLRGHHQEQLEDTRRQAQVEQELRLVRQRHRRIRLGDVLGEPLRHRRTAAAGHLRPRPEHRRPRVRPERCQLHHRGHRRRDRGRRPLAVGGALVQQPRPAHRRGLRRRLGDGHRHDGRRGEGRLRHGHQRGGHLPGWRAGRFRPQRRRHLRAADGPVRPAGTGRVGRRLHADRQGLHRLRLPAGGDGTGRHVRDLLDQGLREPCGDLHLHGRQAQQGHQHHLQPLAGLRLADTGRCHRAARGDRDDRRRQGGRREHRPGLAVRLHR
ncbi:hypothetical protein EES39_07090 [Streptomyces sp. ADI92-24]|nr:hypothetical protein EES39_07090 [Streptomyces sp. ADI92-24]